MSAFIAWPPGFTGGRHILTGAQMRAADTYTIEHDGVPGAVLMETAGRHVAMLAHQMVPGGRIAVICGAGNNGGDGWVAARYLRRWDHTVDVVLWADRSRITGDALIHLQIAESQGVDVLSTAPIAHYDLIIDALLGTGLSGAVRDSAVDAINWMNGRAPILAVDIPSGLCSDSGQPLGVCVRAAATMTFAASKWGHWSYPGRALCGALHVADIGISDMAIAAVGATAEVLTDIDLEPAFASRDPEGHKGTYGHVGIVGGSAGRLGALRMAADAALRAGAGLVTIVTEPRLAEQLQTQVYEAMVVGCEPMDWLPVLGRFDVIVLGPGLSSDTAVGEATRATLAALKCPVVIDADALNHIAGSPSSVGPGLRVLTPHPGEAGRLLGCTTKKIQENRPAAARQLAGEYKAIAVLKGAHTLIADPAETLRLCPDGNPGMGSGGMGDVLSGVVGALLARGLSGRTAARAAVLWHAQAGDRVARSGQNAVLARDVIAALAKVEAECCPD